MTNLTMTLLLITNWTGYTFQNQELGYIATNHVATVTYQDTTNQFVLKTVVSDKAVWRQYKPYPFLITNSPTFVWTN